MYPVNRLHTILSIVPALLLIVGPIAFGETVREFTPSVARISSIEGPVTVQRTVDEDWTDATLNLPLMVGDKIYTGVGSRAELQLDDEVVVRLESDTYIHFANLEDTLTRVGVFKGNIAVHASPVTYKRAPVEVQTESFLAQIKDNGKIRFNTRANGDADILARRGEVLVTVGDQPYQLQRGDQLHVNNEPPAKADFVKIDGEDAFDQWCDMRDAMEAASVSRGRVNTRVAGYSDLDRHGTWVDVPDYGTVWRPAVTVVDWAPYRDGRWVWYDSCGWTWVSYEPWGWVPYHYGRWVHVKRYNWCWVPHHEIVHVVHHPPRPVWYPALVSFTYARHGKGFHFSIGGGYHGACVGWFALGPRDPFVPWHRRHHHMYARYHDGPPHGDRGPDRGRDGRRSPSRGDNVVVNNTTINNNITVYQNQDAPNAVTVVSERDFASGTQENRAIATLDTGKRDNEVSVGTAAIQQMEQKRMLDTRPERNANATANTTTAAKSNADRNVSPARAERTSNASPQRGTTPERAVKTASSSRETPNAQTSEQRRNDNGTTAKVSPTTSTRDARTPVQTRETQAARTSEPRTSNRTSLIQDRTAATGSEAARTTSNARTTQDARTAIVNPNRTTTTSPTRSTSPERTSSVQTNSAARQSLIQERPETRTSQTRSAESNRTITNPARETQSAVRQSTTSDSATYSPSRSYSQPRTNTQSTQRQSYSPAKTYSTPRNYSTQSAERSYSPSRSTGATQKSYSNPQTYSSPQNYSAQRSYSTPQQNGESQSYSTQRSTSPSRSSSTTSSSRSSRTSSSRTSQRR